MTLLPELLAQQNLLLDSLLTLLDEEFDFLKQRQAFELPEIASQKQLLLEQNDKMQWHPEFMKKRSNDWIENLQRDRNISRSRKYGIPLPVRYTTANNEIILPSEEQLARGPIDPTSDLPDGYTAEQVRGETLVLDTRFTS